MKASILILLIFVGLQSMTSCKFDDVSPISPEKTEGRVNIPKLGAIINLPKPVIGSPSNVRDSFEGQPMSDIVCTGLPSDNLTPGCPWVTQEETVSWYRITVVIPMPKNQIK
jgi:hypothetical protein